MRLELQVRAQLQRAGHHLGRDRSGLSTGLRDPIDLDDTPR
jgi:hypothetical protein